MTSNASSITVVEDDRSVRDMLQSVLEHEGFTVDAFVDGEAALAHPDASRADLVILDAGLPGMDGLAVCRALRLRGRAGPILMLTARHEVEDRVRGLDAGADDYLVKPFALAELLARVRAGVRRAGRDRPPAGQGGAVVAVADLAVDTATHEVRRGQRLLETTKLEFDLLHLLVANSPTVLTRDVIHDRIWGTEEAHLSNTLEVFISQLRKKTEADGEARLIHTVRGVGYVARPST